MYSPITGARQQFFPVTRPIPVPVRYRPRQGALSTGLWMRRVDLPHPEGTQDTRRHVSEMEIRWSPAIRAAAAGAGLAGWRHLHRADPGVDGCRTWIWSRPPAPGQFSSSRRDDGCAAGPSRYPGHGRWPRRPPRCSPALPISISTRRSPPTTSNRERGGAGRVRTGGARPAGPTSWPRAGCRPPRGGPRSPRARPS